MRFAYAPPLLEQHLMPIPFVKMQGCGNDFVVLDARARSLPVDPVRAAAIADRHRGVGCDQLIIIDPGPSIRIFNPDGSAAEACGNATRCVAHLLTGGAPGSVEIDSPGGLLAATVLPDGRVQVDMGRPRLRWDEVPLSHEADTLHIPLALGAITDPAGCSMGNPHATFFVPDVAAIDIPAIGSALEHDPLFPARANIGFAQVLGADRIRLRVWERGAGLTLACGSGACAALVNAHRRGLTGCSATMLLDGGELTIDWRDDGHVVMTGPVAVSFTGELPNGAFI